MPRRRFWVLFFVATASAVIVSFFWSAQEQPPAQSAGITLGLTSEAKRSLQQAGQAFPAAQAGFSAYYRVPDGAGGFGLDKYAVDQDLFADPGPTTYRSGIGTLLESGQNYTVGSIPIINIDGLTTQVHLYYDDQGWVVAYFPSGQESSRTWQAVDLSIENPALVDISRTTLSDAVNGVVAEALNLPPITHDQLGYYHWEHPTATNFLMFATARGTAGSDVVSFAVPSNFTVHEVSASMWISETNLPCARTSLDGADLTGDQCDRSFHHASVNPTQFSALSAHTLVLEHLGQDKGASGALVMLVYSTS